jgi:hypothetical protein
MDGVAVEVLVAAPHYYGDNNDGDNNDVGDDSNGGDRDGDNTHSCVRGKRGGDAEATEDEVAVRMDGAVVADAEAAVQTRLYPATSPDI